MLADDRDTAEAAVPPESAASGETRPLIGAEVAAPGAEPKKDAEQEASEEIARSDTLLAAWERGLGQTAKAKERFDLAIQPVVSGEGAAIFFLGRSVPGGSEARSESEWRRALKPEWLNNSRPCTTTTSNS